MGMLGKEKVATVAFPLPCRELFYPVVFGFPPTPARRCL